MPSAKSRAAKAATAARIAAYNAAAAALESESELAVKATGTVGMMNISPDFDGLTDKTSANNVGGILTSTNTLPFKPTLPSMLNLNTSPNMSRALAVGAVMVGAEQTGNPSDEENVQPMVTGMPPSSTTSPNKVEDRSARALSPIFGNIDNERDVRAYEFERQKVKRAGELVKRKAAKAAKTTGGYLPGSGGGHSHTGRSASECTAGDRGRKDVKSRIGPSDMDVDTAETRPEKPAAEVTSRIEVSLSELVLRQKKPRKVKEDDFEMISPVRPVIALDDLEAKDIDIDEPWEHVERDFEKPKEGEPSYAAVLLGIAH